MSEFQKVGPSILFGETEVDLAEVQPIHDIAAQEMLLAARKPRMVWDEESGTDSLRYTTYFHSLDEEELDFPERFVSVSLKHLAEPDSWSLLVSLCSYKMSERHSNKRICYRFRALENELVEAKKEVFLVIGKSAIGFDEDGEPIEIVDTQRKCYERQMTANDCDNLQYLMGRTISRAAVSRK